MVGFFLFFLKFLASVLCTWLSYMTMGLECECCEFKYHSRQPIFL